MAVNTKAIKTRIKSVKNTKKITKAMEMVSAAKMRKAVDATLATRLYATMARELLQKLSALDVATMPLLAIRPIKKILLVVVSSNRGLCGSYNNNIFKKTSLVIREAGVPVDMIGVGKKSALFAKKLNVPLLAVYDQFGDNPDFATILTMTSEVLAGFTRGDYDKVMVVYTDFKSSMVQEPAVRQILPLSEGTMGDLLNGLRGDSNPELTGQPLSMEEYLLEPDARTIALSVIPRLVEMQVYQAILESAASEHSSRMVAMKSASDAASDMIRALTTEFNKGRQAAITQEIAEIVGGAVALE